MGEYLNLKRSETGRKEGPALNSMIGQRKNTGENKVEAMRDAAATCVRYHVLGLTFFMAMLMYMERGAIGAAVPSIMREFRIDKITMGWSVSAFNWSYALFQVPGGWLADRYGSRIVLTAAIAWWSAFTAATSLSFNAISLAICRFLFGAGEASAFPAGSRALVRWLPVEQRAFGQGFQHSGARLGAALAPLIVVSLIAAYGWRFVFYVFGALGVVWSAAWFGYYRNLPSDHPRTNAAELALLPKRFSRAPCDGRRSVPWGRILRSRDLWYLSLVYFCYGWVLWLYLAWFPTYLREARHFTALKSGLASIPLFAAAVTNVCGGVLSDRLTARLGNLRKGRLSVSIAGFLIAAIALVPGVLVASPVIALVSLTIALGGLELTVAVSWAMCLDIGGEYSGSVSSVMNTWGNLGGAISAVMVGYLATLFGWTSPFIMACLLCLLSAFVVSRIEPRRSAV
jgi:MFS transporter, ACS family, glucarate transporter